MFTAFHHWRNFVRKKLDPSFVSTPKVYSGFWNPRAELEAYLKEDVLILAEGFARHCELFMATSATSEDSCDGLDPFCVKIATKSFVAATCQRYNFSAERIESIERILACGRS